MKILKNKDSKTNIWLGGTTTEIYIYPKGSEYKKLDFNFRVSSATIDSEISKFTSLDGINRDIMILDGKIEHKDRYKKVLNRLEVDNFKGEWETVSKGKCYRG